LPQQLEELKVNELRSLLRMTGGKPSSKRKAQLVAQLHAHGFSCYPDVSCSYSQRTKDAQAGGTEKSQQLLSYRQWMAVKLCSPYPEFLGVFNNLTIGRLSLAQSEATLTAGNLEKLCGMVLKGFVKAKNVV
jgi:hypothetical protein